MEKGRVTTFVLLQKETWSLEMGLLDHPEDLHFEGLVSSRGFWLQDLKNSVKCESEVVNRWMGTSQRWSTTEVVDEDERHSVRRHKETDRSKTHHPTSHWSEKTT